MINRNKFFRTLGLSAAALSLTLGSANAGLETGNAQVVVLSTITATEVTALNFGTVAAFADGDTPANLAILTMPADGTGSALTFGGAGAVANSNIVVIAEGNPGSFAISGAAPNAVLSLTLGGAGNLTDPSLASAHLFVFAAAGIYVTLNGSGNTFTYDTDATGALEFNVGGTITTDDNAMAAADLAPYDDATYTGTYTVDISY